MVLCRESDFISGDGGEGYAPLQQVGGGVFAGPRQPPRRREAQSPGIRSLAPSGAAGAEGNFPDARVGA